MALKTFDTFIQEVGYPYSAYVTEPGFSDLYVRRTPYYLVNNKRYEKVIVLALFAVKEKGKGTFTKFLNKCMNLGFPVIVECCHNERLAKYLERRGFREDTDHPLNWYWIPDVKE